MNTEKGTECVAKLAEQVRYMAKLVELIQTLSNECFLSRLQLTDPKPDRAAALFAAQRATDEAIDGKQPVAAAGEDDAQD
jgi:hypothetical protein